MSDAVSSNGEQDVHIGTNLLRLPGQLMLPPDATGVVLFAHGSGSSRFSARNRCVARHLNDNGLGTLLFDLLTAEEEVKDQATREFRFDIPLLAERVVMAVDHVTAAPRTRHLFAGLFGASTGAAAALIAAAARPRKVHAVVSRGGRPDLAAAALARVAAPTLLVVGGNDAQVIELNHQAAAKLRCEHRTVIVPGASHLFEEAGALEAVQSLASEWFVAHLRGMPVTSP